MLQKKFLALVHKSHEKVKEREDKKLVGWLTRHYMTTKLKWSKTLGPIAKEECLEQLSLCVATLISNNAA